MQTGGFSNQIRYGHLRKDLTGSEGTMDRPEMSLVTARCISRGLISSDLNPGDVALMCCRLQLINASCENGAGLIWLR